MNALATRKRLLFEFALTPDAIDAAVSGLDKAKRDTVVLALRNMRVNGFLANLRHGEWLRYIRDKVEHATNQEAKQLVMACLNQLYDRGRIVLHPVQPAAAEPSAWIDAALASHARFGMDGIFVDDTQRSLAQGKPGEDLVIPISDATNSQQWKAFEKRTESVRKTEAGYGEILETVLAYATWVLVFDRYLLHGYGHFGQSASVRAIRVISERLGARRTRGAVPHATVLLRAAKSTQQHGEKNWTIDDHYRRGWEPALRPLAQQYGVRYLVYLDPTTTQHENRCLITNQCGLLTGDSFGCFPEEDARSDDWALLDATHRQELLWKHDFRSDNNIRSWLEVTADGGRIVLRDPGGPPAAR